MLNHCYLFPTIILCLLMLVGLSTYSWRLVYSGFEYGFEYCLGFGNYLHDLNRCLFRNVLPCFGKKVR